MMLVFPLYYKNGYIDILRAKRALFLDGTAVFLLWMLLLSVFEVLINEKNERKNGKKERKEEGNRSRWRKPGKADLRYLVYSEIAVLLISTLGAEEKQDVFLGLTGRYLGSLAMIMGWITVLLIAKYVQWNLLLNWIFLIGAGNVYLLQILNTCGIDPLGMQAKTAEWMRIYFISTIGNINFNSSFDCMTLPVIMVFYAVCRERFSRIVYGGVLCLGSAAAVCCRSDSVYLGLGIGFLALLACGFLRWEYLSRCAEEMSLCLLSMLLTVLFIRYRIGGDALLGLGIPVADMRFVAVEILCVGMLWFLILGGKKGCFWKNEIQREGCLRIWRKVYGALLSMGGGILLLGMILVNKTSLLPVQKMPFYRMYLTDEWGSSRGYVWKRCVEIFRQQPLFDQIFGSGMNSTGFLLNDYFGEEMQARFSVKFIDAHNEALQYLLSIGVVGTVLYFMILLGILVSGIKALKAGNERAMFVVCAIPAFLAQGLVNNPQIATTPLLFMGLGIFWNIINRNHWGIDMEDS